MAKFYATHEIRNGGKKPIMPGEPIECTEEEAEHLMAYGAISIDPPVKTKELTETGPSASQLEKAARAAAADKKK